MTVLEDRLLTIEKALWVGGGEPYRRHVDDRCMLAFTEMAGRYSRDEVAAMVDEGTPRWHDVELDVEGILRPTESVAVLTYRAHAVRGANEHYHAVVSSGYVQRDGEWKLMFHQQTPIAG
jgi:hypothetical protein